MFHIEIEREADGRWIAEIPAIPGCMAYAETADAARRAVEALALRIIEEIEDAEDRAALAALDRQEAALGRERARGRYLTAEDVQRLCDGASPLAVWRGKRGLTQIALAHLAGVAPSYVADIERGAKRGSVTVLAKLAAALDIEAGDLIRQAPTSA